MRIVIVTGLSGGGKSTALRALEDIGYYCVDNVPLPLFPALLELVETAGTTNVAVSVDARQQAFLSTYREQLNQLQSAGHTIDVLYLEAPDDILIRRYSETRRKHPLAGDDLRAGIRRDREVLAELREDAAVVSTKNLNVHQLKGYVEERYGRRDREMAVSLLSFGFKHGLPAEADLVFDVRYLPNPYFVEELSAKTGRNAEVSSYVLGSEDGKDTLEAIRGYIEMVLPKFAEEGKKYLTVAIGCTGGRHRSVAIVEALREGLAADWDVFCRHRDLGEGE